MIRRQFDWKHQPLRLAGGVLAIAAMAGAVLAAPAARACGYHNPQHMARGIMNWTYPKSLYVGTAVWMAEDSGVLPPRPAQEARDMFAYQRMVANLQTLGERLAGSRRSEPLPVTFSVVLLDSMLWVRFLAGPEGYSVKVHADGPAADDVVLVTHGKVIKALVRGGLDAGKAERLSLIRFYRNERSHDSLRRLLATPARVHSRAEETSR